MRRCVFLDRDGVINRSPGDGYVTSVADFILTDGIADVLRDVHRAGWLAIVVTSQRCVGRGLIDLQTLETIHQAMQDQLMDRCGSSFDAIYAFSGLPHTDAWEKPNPGMIDQAVMDHQIDIKRSIMIGDQDRDIEMAVQAGVGKTIRVLCDDRPQEIAADYTLASVNSLPPLLQELL